MTGPVESLTQQLVRKVADPFGLAILTGVVSSSFGFFGGLELALDGPLAATITESERVKKGVSVTSALKLWEWMFNRAKKRFASATMLGATSYLVASVFRPDLRPILYGASLLSFSIAPYTLIVLMPINKDILKLANDVSKPDAKSPDSGLVDKLFSEWIKYNSIRLSIGVVAWSLGAATLFLA